MVGMHWYSQASCQNNEIPINWLGKKPLFQAPDFLTHLVGLIPRYSWTFCDQAKKNQILARAPLGPCLRTLARFHTDWLVPGPCQLLNITILTLELSEVASKKGRPGCGALGMGRRGPQKAQGQHEDLAPRGRTIVRRRGGALNQQNQPATSA